MITQVAESSGMMPEVDLLMRNREANGGAAAGGGGGAQTSTMGRTLPRRILGLVLSVLSSALRAGRCHPRVFALTILAALAAVYVASTAGR